jgi:hypothetical protein
VSLLQEHGWLGIKRKRTYDPKTKTWRTRNVYMLRFENVPIIFDAITASRLGRRFKRDTDDTLKYDTSVTLTPSEKHALPVSLLMCCAMTNATLKSLGFSRLS